jgi:chemotaxis protein CheX
MTSAFRFDVNFINPFIEGTIETLKIQCGFVTINAGKPYSKGQGPQPSSDLAAVIGLTSTAFNGSVAICFPEEVFLAIMEKMLGEKYTTITQDVEDGASELLNIIFGQAKKSLNALGYAIDRAVPTIVRGESLNVFHLTRSPTIMLPFESEVGAFHIEIVTEKD